MKAKLLYDEWRSLTIESISFQRAGIDCAMTDAMRIRDTYVYDRITDIEKELFPMLTDRKEVNYKNELRTKFWEDCDKMKVDGYIVVDNNITCDEFSCIHISGKVIFAKHP